jgi:hypothetical protein
MKKREGDGRKGGDGRREGGGGRKEKGDGRKKEGGREGVLTNDRAGRCQCK